MIANQIVPIILYGAIVLNLNISFGLSLWGWVIVFFNAIILNYIGSIAGFIGIKESPNSGYSVIIQKSYALWTTVVSVFLFNSEFPLFKIFGILLILVFTAIISVEKIEKKFVIGKWFWYSLLAFFLFGGTTITARYIAILGDNPTVYLFWVMVVTTIVAIIDYLKNIKNIEFKFDKNIILWLFAMSSAVSIFYWGKNLATVYAPNVGYVGAINASSNAVLVILSSLFFKEELKLYKIFAVVGVVIGIAILVM